MTKKPRPPDVIGNDENYLKQLAASGMVKIRIADVHSCVGS